MSEKKETKNCGFLICFKMILTVFITFSVFDFSDVSAALKCKFNDNYYDKNYTYSPTVTENYDWWDNTKLSSECDKCTGQVSDDSPCGYSNYSPQHVAPRQLDGWTAEKTIEKCRANEDIKRKWLDYGFDCGANLSQWDRADNWGNNYGPWYSYKEPAYWEIDNVTKIGNVTKELIQDMDGTEQLVRYIYLMGAYYVGSGGNGVWQGNKPGDTIGSYQVRKNYGVFEANFKSYVRGKGHGQTDAEFYQNYKIIVDKAGSAVTNDSGIFRTSSVGAFLNKNGLNVSAGNFRFSGGNIYIDNFKIETINGSIYGQPIKCSADLVNTRQRDYYYWIPYRLKLTYDIPKVKEPCKWTNKNDSNSSVDGDCNYSLRKTHNDTCKLTDGTVEISNAQMISSYCYIKDTLKTQNTKKYYYENYNIRFNKEGTTSFSFGESINWPITATYSKDYSLVFNIEALKKISSLQRTKQINECLDYLNKPQTKTLPENFNEGEWEINNSGLISEFRLNYGNNEISNFTSSRRTSIRNWVQGLVSTNSSESPKVDFHYSELATYQYKDQFIQAGTGALFDTLINSNNYTQLPKGSFLITPQMNNGRHLFNVNLNSINGIDSKTLSCPYIIANDDNNPDDPTRPTPITRRIIWRPISLNNPFPGFDGGTRERGSNWTQNDIDNNIDPNVYQEDPIYRIELGPAEIRRIRAYNESNDYSDFTLNCVNGNTNCRFSDEVRNLLENANAQGRCWAENANYESCRN